MSLVETETSKSGEYVYMLRGRDGIQGRDGRQGRDGPQGRDGIPGGIGVQGPPGPPCGGTAYIRWGNSSCPGVTGNTLVYTGFAGGSLFYRSGGGANYLCMPDTPEYSSTLTYRAGVQNYSPIHGAEYQYPIVGSNDHNVPCALCHVSSRSVLIVIPAMASCPSDWTREYYGYLMSAYQSQKRSTFVCVDESMESIPDSQADTSGALFYHTEAHCGTGLPCTDTTYNNHKELNCVVCTK